MVVITWTTILMPYQSRFCNSFEGWPPIAEISDLQIVESDNMTVYQDISPRNGHQMKCPLQDLRKSLSHEIGFTH